MIFKFSKKIILISLILMFGFFSITQSAFNPQINYQGKLTGVSGEAVGNGSYNLQFKLYTVSSGGTAIWTETLTLSNRALVTNGLFSVLLGNVTSISGVDFNQDLYLGVNVGGTSDTPVWDGEMTPRKRIGSVPSAFEADKLDGLDSTQFVRSDQSGSVGGTLTAGNFVATSTSSHSTFVNASSTQQTVSGSLWSGNTLTTGNTISATNNSGVNVYDNDSNGISVEDGGNVGIGTTAPVVNLEVHDGSSHAYSELSSTGTALEAAQRYYDGTTRWSTGLQGDTASVGDYTVREAGVGSWLTVQKTSGNVGVGVTAPLGQLHIQNSSVTSAGAPLTGSGIVLDQAGDSYLQFRDSTGSTNEQGILFGDDDADAGYIKFLHGTNAIRLGTVFGEAMRIVDGNVGIGTTTPSYLLDISGSMRLSEGGIVFPDGSSMNSAGAGSAETISTSNDAVITADSDSNSSGEIQFNIGGSEKMVILNGGNIGIGSAAPGKKLDVTGDARVSGVLTTANASTTLLTSTTSWLGTIISGIWNGTAIDVSDYTNLTAGTNITLSGDTLNVDDSFLVNDADDTTTGVITSAGLVVGDGNTVGATTNKWLFDDSNNDITTTGNVGVGTTAPATNLHSYDTSEQLRLGYDASNYASFTVDSASSLTITPSISTATTTIGSGDEALRIASTGNVGVGITAPTYQLQLSTDSAAKPGTSSWTVDSDERLKDINGDFTRGLDSLFGLYPSYFNYKIGNARNIPTSREYVGLIAQDVQKVIPEAVREGSDGYLSIETDPIFWTMLNAIKELAIEIGSDNISYTRDSLAVQNNNDEPQVKIGYDEENYMEMKVDDSGDLSLSTVGTDINFPNDNVRVCSEGSCSESANNMEGTGNLVVENTAYVGGALGVGTAEPKRALDVFETQTDPQVRISYDEDFYAELGVSATGDLNISAEGGDISALDENLKICSGDGCPSIVDNLEGTGNLVVENNIISLGNVGVNTANPSYTLDVNGTLRAYGITDASDRRLKTNIQTLTKPTLDSVNNLRGVTFEWKDKNFGTGTQIGMIAQELEEEYPDLVETDQNGYKSIQYGKFTAVLLESIKELFSWSSTIEYRSERLEERTAKLEEENDMLKQRMGELEVRMGALE